MATYNGEKYIEQQLESILSQLGKSDEVIISDDASTDNTLSVIRSFDDDRITLYHLHQDKHKLNKHLRISSNFENALQKAKGDYIFLSDQDDIWAANKVAEMMKFLPSYALVVSNLVYMEDNLPDLSRKPVLKKSPYHNFLITQPQYYGCCMAFQRTVLDKALPFPKKLPSHDGWIGMVAETTGKVKFIEQPLVCYRIHDRNVSGKNKSDNPLCYKFTYRIRMYFNLLKRMNKYNKMNKNTWTK
ncbi:MAG: glycosyltransferase family 2 protein [Bacteroidales bacterium]|nr:glycosyltransferase family 2 protein [Bacteroidales bacterium]